MNYITSMSGHSDNVITKKVRTIQVRITSKDYDLIRAIREIDGDFNVSNFLRNALREHGKMVCSSVGIGKLRIGI